MHTQVTGRSLHQPSASLLQDFLTTVRESAERVGECAMHQAQRLTQLELSHEVLERLSPERKGDLDLCPQDLVDFSPVYRSLHIFSVLVCVCLCVCFLPDVTCCTKVRLIL